MAERLTNTLEETPTLGFGLKFCSDRNCNSDEDCCNCYAFNQTINKLRQLEDIMEKYGIESLDILEQELKIAYEIERLKDKKVDLNNAIIVFNKDFIKDYIREIEKLETDRDTWKRACELACKHIAEVEWLSCPETDDISESENEIKTLTKQSLNFFYQQAKKEGEQK